MTTFTFQHRSTAQIARSIGWVVRFDPHGVR